MENLYVATVLTVYSIETFFFSFFLFVFLLLVATVLTVYSIETINDGRVINISIICCNSAYCLRY